MSKRSRWEKVAHLIEEVLEDEKLRKTLQEGSREDKLKVLEQRGFNRDDRMNLDKDLERLFPRADLLVRFWV